MKISDYKFSNSEIENLQKYRDNQINTRLKFRFVALLMLAKGICIETVSIIIGKSKQIIESYFNWLNVDLWGKVMYCHAR